MNGLHTSSDDFHWVIEKKNRVVSKIRIGALHTLFADRYTGGREDYVFPEDDAGLEDLKILLHHYAWSNPLAIARQIKLRAPWMGHNGAISVTEEIFTFPRRWRSETLGRLLRFTGEEWRRLRIRTIAPIDMTKEERRAFCQRLANERKRKKHGRATRQEYLATHDLTRTQPWAAEGISRRTWERRRKAK